MNGGGGGVSISGQEIKLNLSHIIIFLIYVIDTHHTNMQVCITHICTSRYVWFYLHKWSPTYLLGGGGGGGVWCAFACGYLSLGYLLLSIC